MKSVHVGETVDMLLALASCIASVGGALFDEAQEPPNGLRMIVVLLAFEDHLWRGEYDVAMWTE